MAPYVAQMAERVALDFKIMKTNHQAALVCNLLVESADYQSMKTPMIMG